MRTTQTRSRHALVTVVIGCLSLGSAACSHDDPYVRDSLGSDRAPQPSANEIRQRVVFIGDAGAPSERGEPVLETLREASAQLPDRTVVVFLGDNIYPAGLPDVDDPGRADAERALQAQLDAVGEASSVFIAGNHDWGAGRVRGPAALKRLDAWLDRVPNAQLSPKAGCSGPVALTFEAVRLVTLDTQWWLSENTDTPNCRTQGFAALEDGANADGRVSVVVGHHPIASRGPHGGFFTAREWLRPSKPYSRRTWVRWIPPLPGAGPLSRLLDPSPQDFASSEYARFQQRMAAALESNPPLVYASGHEHSLQVFDGGDAAELLLVSGAGSAGNTTPVGHEQRTQFAHSHAGFMVLDILDDRALLRVVEPGASAVRYWREIPLH